MSKTDTDKAIEEMLGNSEEAGTETENPSTTEVENTEANASENTETEESAQTEGDGTDWKAEARKWETRSKENKGQVDSLTTRVSELETALSEAQAQAAEVTKWKVAAKYKVSEEDVELFLTASDEDTLIKQAERLSQSSTHAPKPDAAQGTRNDTGPLSTKQQGAAALEGLFN